VEMQVVGKRVLVIVLAAHHHHGGNGRSNGKQRVRREIQLWVRVRRHGRMNAVLVVVSQQIVGNHAAKAMAQYADGAVEGGQGGTDARVLVIQLFCDNVQDGLAVVLGKVVDCVGQKVIVDDADEGDGRKRD
jgi:hypothetical protein